MLLIALSSFVSGALLYVLARRMESAEREILEAWSGLDDSDIGQSPSRVSGSRSSKTGLDPMLLGALIAALVIVAVAIGIFVGRVTT